MADFPTYYGLQVSESNADGTDTGGTAVTASGTANTKGSYSQLIASTTYHTSYVIVTLSYPADATAADWLVDVAIGAASSEQVVIPNLLFTKAGTSSTNIARQQTYTYTFPLSIPAGTRLSARCQCSTASAPIDVTVYCFSQSFLPSAVGSKVVDIGTATADSGATQITAGTSNSKGSWTQMTASSDHIKGFVLACGWRQIDFAANVRFHVDVGIGSAASEKVVLPDWSIMEHEGEQLNTPVSAFFPIEIPSSSRIAVRVQQDTTNSRGNIDWALYGVV